MRELLAILDGAITWLGGRGLDQWQGARWRADELRPDLRTGALRVAEMRAAPTAPALPGELGVPSQAGRAGSAEAGAPPVAPSGIAAPGAAGSPASGPAASGPRDIPTPVATMTLRDAPGEGLWRPADDPASALYLSHLAVDRALAGRGIGTWLLDQAAAEAARRGKRSVRLDAWTTNTRLHDYYRNHGFRLVRIAGDRTSGALFERPVSPP
ncbi:GNAT family N-acetyltransferase [Amycolatopsis mongoliensis]|uniref:GNAT family N-acetyltransferase n=1 Tax=Amycolatopsis mongoliensis TaxID=715475 RepID=A0A9Y2NLK6_9PSEU|nr:GNAT family N-acetyltransferase [Amycolatopsis sp. 4-36]WIY02355.1 GNAT family N-acetyltransferase [Amycolatopsis sp. 4-36]